MPMDEPVAVLDNGYRGSTRAHIGEDGARGGPEERTIVSTVTSVG